MLDIFSYSKWTSLFHRYLWIWLSQFSCSCFFSSFLDHSDFEGVKVPRSGNRISLERELRRSKMEVSCYNRGCGKKFNPRDNPPDSTACTFHPGAPYFHDAYKGWSCCSKKCTDFTEFLNFPGTFMRSLWTWLFWSHSHWVISMTDGSYLLKLLIT